MKRLIIIHGEPNSGKTTLANTLCSRLDEVAVRLGGILQTVPLPHLPKKEYQGGDLATGRVKVLLTTESPPDASWKAWQRFFLNVSAFEWANQVLLQAPTNSDLVVIDEIGKLELEGEGFTPALKALISASSWNLLLVIRTSLLKEVAQYFKLSLDEALLVESQGEIDELYRQVVEYLELP